MKLRSTAALLSILLLGACATPEVTQPVASKTQAAKPVAPATAAAAAPAKPAANPIPTPTLPSVAFTPPPVPVPTFAPEVMSLVVHLTEGEQSDTLAHDVVDTTGFPEAMASLAPGATAPKIEKNEYKTQAPPRGLTADGDTVGLVDRDWTGLVLVPINKSLSKAHTSAVRLLKVEAHPLQDGRVRVWIRMQNIGRKELPSEVACTFSMRGDTLPVSANFYELAVPSREYRDVFFVSPQGELVTYTVLVRSNNLARPR